MTSTASIRAVFVDTSAWLMLMNRNERLHETAVAFHRGLDSGTTRLITWGILSETYTWLRYHAGYRDAERWLHEALALQSRGVLEVVYPTEDADARVAHYLSRFSDQDLSYVDAFSLHVIDTRGDVDAVFAFDHHLILARKPVVPGPVGPGGRWQIAGGIVCVAMPGPTRVQARPGW